MSEIIGIDKLRLSAREFKIDSIHNFTAIQNHHKDTEIPLIYRYKNGNEIRANKMYFNGELANYTINRYGLKVEFNPNKIYHNYKNANLSRLPNALKMIEKEAADNGLPYVNLTTSTVSRIDVCRQSEMDNNFLAYQPVFSMLKANRQLTRDYGTTYNISNKSTGLVMYDKGKELNDKHSISIPEKNLMRGEVRYLNSKAVRSNLPVYYFSDLLSMTNADIHEIYRDKMKKYIGERKNVVPINFSLHQELENMKYFLEEGKKNWFERWLLSAFDIQQFVSDKFTSYNNLLTCFDYLELNKHQKFRLKTKINEYLNNCRPFSAGNLVNLFDEFEQKFAS